MKNDFNFLRIRICRCVERSDVELTFECFSCRLSKWNEEETKRNLNFHWTCCDNIYFCHYFRFVSFAFRNDIILFSFLFSFISCRYRNNLTMLSISMLLLLLFSDEWWSRKRRTNIRVWTFWRVLFFQCKRWHRLTIE